MPTSGLESSGQNWHSGFGNSHTPPGLYTLGDLLGPQPLRRPLASAAESGFQGVAELLLTHGAKADEADEAGGSIWLLKVDTCKNMRQIWTLWTEPAPKPPHLESKESRHKHEPRPDATFAMC